MSQDGYFSQKAAKRFPVGPGQVKLLTGHKNSFHSGALANGRARGSPMNTPCPGQATLFQ